MDLREITSLISQVAKTVKANEKLALPLMAAKARKVAQNYPTDVPIINCAQVLTKMASDKTFITKEELSGIVERFSASHSKLSSVFAEELGKQSPHKPQTFQRESSEGQSLDVDYAKFADPVLANALKGVFAKDPVEQIYSPEDAQRAQRAAHAQLIGLGIEPRELKTFAGRKGIIIVQAVHETPMGISNVLVPVELQDEKAVLPTLFFGASGFTDLEKNAYVSNMKRTAGKAWRVDGAKLLDVLERVKNSSQGINDVELAAIKVASTTGTPSMDPNAIFYGKLNDESPDVKIPKMASTKESKFAETLGKPDGIARFVHGDRVVEAGRAMLVRKFAEIGYSSVQVKVANAEKDKIIYAVGVGVGTGLLVPIEVVGTLVSPPKIVVADGTVTAFNKQAISEIVKSGAGGSRRALATASPCYDMKPSELLDVVKESCAAGNYIRAEDAINVLGEVDPHAQRVAIAHMMMNIYEPGKEPAKEMAQMQQVASQPIKDTPMFMNYKIYFPEGA